jgi:MFS family permease
MKSFLAEISDETNQGKAFGLISTAWGAGCIIAPAVGGFLAGKRLWGHDYLLANLVVAGWGLFTFVVTLTCVVEADSPKNR